MKKQIETNQKNWDEEFEEIFILTCHDIYGHTRRLMDYDDEGAVDLLIETYAEAYKRKVNLPSMEKQTAWLKKIADSVAEVKVGLLKEEIEAAYSEARQQAAQGGEEVLQKLDEASIYLEIEDRINQLEMEEEPGTQGAVMTTVQGIFSGILLVAAIAALVVGVSKAKQQLDLLREPFTRTLAHGDETQETDPQNQAVNRVKVAGKVVYLSEIGQVLYSLPIADTDLASESPYNPEIQKQTGWTYYLPCPDRKDTQLKDVAPSLYNTLYRMRGDGEEIEIVADEVEDYALWEDGIYVSQFGRIQRIDIHDAFERQVPGIYAEVKNGEVYLYDTLGRMLNTAADGSIHYEDRIFTMYSNRIEAVNPAPRERNHITYYFKESEEGRSKEIYRNVNGQEELYEKNGEMIDSFCIGGDWLYYSAYIRRGGSGAHYSEIYRKSLTEDKEAELICEEFTGRIRQMYYSEEAGQIYANYIPKNWKSNHGVIAVITPSGQMSCLDDESIRAERETTGNDILEFIMVRDGQVYCYWEDCIWKPGETPIAIWRKVITIPNDDRVWMDQ